MKKTNFSTAILLQGIFYFLLTFVLIILSARLVLKQTFVYVPSEPISLWYFLIVFLFVTVAMVFLLRRVKTRLPFEVFFTLAIFAGIWFLADIWFSPGLAIIAALTITLLKFIYPRIWWQNLIIVFGVCGIVVSLGLSITWITAVVILVFLSFYDIIAVYFTRHMVTMFKGLLKRGVIFALILPTHLKFQFLPLKQVKPGENFMLLGTGDLALPAVLVSSLVRESLGQAIFVAAGAVLGFAIMNIIFTRQKARKPMPALPPIAAGASLGFLIALLIGL